MAQEDFMSNAQRTKVQNAKKHISPATFLHFCYRSVKLSKQSKKRKKDTWKTRRDKCLFKTWSEIRDCPKEVPEISGVPGSTKKQKCIFSQYQQNSLSYGQGGKRAIQEEEQQQQLEALLDSGLHSR